MRIKRLGAALVAAATLGAAGVGTALASSVDTAVVDATAPTKAVSLAPEGSAPITINLTVTGNQDGTATFKVYRDWTLSNGAFTGSNAETFTVAPQPGGTTSYFSADGTVSVAPGQSGGTFNLAVAAFDISNSNQTGGKLAAGRAASYAVTVTVPEVPKNVKPSVAVTGFIDGATYELGVAALPTPMCVVTDDHDVVAPFPAKVSGELTHGIGTQTATCDYTDSEGLVADTATASYRIVDTHQPTIGHTLGAEPNANGWYKNAVTVTFNCADDPGSGIQSCLADGEQGPSKVLSEDGGGQSVSGTATDWAGNTATDLAKDINIDMTAPIVTFASAPSGDYYYGDALPKAECAASDALSGIDGDCQVTLAGGDGIGVGTYTYTATASDKAGNTATVTSAYTVHAWRVNGFYRPVDMDGAWNTVKAGSTVPLKFEVFAGTNELTSTSVVKSFSVNKINPGATGASDETPITEMTTGGTSLRYDVTGGQFVQNWQTPKGKTGDCYRVTVTTQDGTAISALFKLK